MTQLPSYDVIVVGGGAAGVGAAVGAAQAGAKALLIECGPCLGGAATQKNVLTYCGLYTQADSPKQAIGGVGATVLEHLQALGGINTPVRISSGHVIALVDPEAVKLALDRIVGAAKPDVLMHTTLIRATRNGDTLTTVCLHDNRGSREIAGLAFVDASGDGDLAAFSGASVRFGNHGITQAGTLGVRYGGIRPGADYSKTRWAQAIQEARQQGNRLIDKEDGLVVKIPISGDLATYYIDATYDALDGASITKAEIQGRERAWAYLDAIRSIPGYEGAYIVSTGPKFGTRESRHVNSRYQVTEDDVTSGARKDDVIALGAWPTELHQGQGKPTIWADIKDKGTFDIPLRSISSVDTSNLFSAGRLIDGDGGGAGSMRVMGTSFGTGHAAGVAAALNAMGSTDVRAVQAELKRQGAFLAPEALETVITHP